MTQAGVLGERFTGVPLDLAECRLTGVAAGGGVDERAEAFACAHVHRAQLLEPPQQNAIR